MATNMLNLTKVENQTILTDVTRYNLSEQIRSAGDRSRRCKKVVELHHGEISVRSENKATTFTVSV